MKKTILITLLIVIVLLTSVSFAKYISEKKNTTLVEAGTYYFESDILSNDATIKSYVLQEGEDTISVILKNNIDDLRYAEVDVFYNVTITDVSGNAVTDKSGNTVSAKAGKLLKDKIDTNVVTFTNLKTGIYRVVATSTAPYEKELKANFTLQEKNEEIEYSIRDSQNSPIVQMTIKTNDYAGSVDITWPEGTTPDNTNPDFVDNNSSYAGGTKTVRYLNNSEVTITFFKEDLTNQFSKNDFSVTSNIPSDVVARIGSTFYTSLQDAVNSTIDNEKTKIYLLKDISESITIAENKDIVLDLLGHTMTNSGNNPIITLNGELYVENGNLKTTSRQVIYNYGILNIGERTELNGNGNNETLLLNENSKTTISGGRITSINSNSIINKGELEITGNSEINGTSTSGSTLYIGEGAKTKITGGKVTAIKFYALRNYGELEISGTPEIVGTASNHLTLKNESSGKANIFGGYITSTEYNVIGNYGEIEIGGNSEIMGTSKAYAAVVNDAKAKIIGGKMTGVGATTVYNRGQLEISGTPEIIGNSKYQAVRNLAGATATITGGTIIANNGYGVRNDADLTISGTVEIIGKSKNEPTLKTSSGSTTTITGGTITAIHDYAIYNEGTITSNGATINGDTYGM